MRNLFSKKLLIGLSIFLLSSTALFAAPKSGKVNLDPAPFKVILDQYYDACANKNSTPDQIKPFLKNPENAASKLDICKAKVQGTVNAEKRGLLKGQKADLSKVKKVAGIRYEGSEKVYVVSYYYFTTQEKYKAAYPTYFRPIKDSNGKIIWKIV